MPAFVEFLQRLLSDGAVVLRQRPQVAPGERREAADLLARACADHALDVAGPLVPFDEAAALRAAELVWWACWFLLQRHEPDVEVERHLLPGDLPTTPAQHLSFDLAGRFLVQVHRRAAAASRDDGLTRRLDLVLRRWPLTGVLADLPEGPAGSVELGGHPGLLLLYAERLAQRARPSWVPAGAALEHVELVFAERGLRVPASLPALAPEGGAS